MTEERVDPRLSGAVRWVGVDLPEVAELRCRLLPAADRVTSRPESILDFGWLGEPAAGPMFDFLLPLLGRAESMRRRFLSVNRLTIEV
jgi:hypothetical protein